MIIINSNDDCRKLYYLLYLIKQINKESPIAIEIKRALREYSSRPTMVNVILRDYGIDGYISLEELPSHVKSRKEALDFFKQNMRKVCRNSQYDTAQAFTIWYRIICRNSKYMVYHCVGFDI